MKRVLNGGSTEAAVWEAYDAAFHEFSEKVRNLQRLTDDPASPNPEIECAVLAVEIARIAYGRARDAAAELLLDAPLTGAPPAEANGSATHTAEIAELLWKGAGRPEGTAVADWLRAEEIIRLARSESFQPCC
jgi:hypothetical protein